MRLSVLNPPSWHHISSVVIQHISDLDELRKHISNGALLVAFDTESFSYLKDGRSRPSGEVSELGFAALEWPCPNLKLYASSKDFAFQNKAKLLNIQLQQRICTHLESTSSPTVHVNREEETEEIIRRFLPVSNKRILVGYSLSAEFRWIAMNCPALAESFVAWVDVQELIMQQYMGQSPISNEALSEHISLRSALHAMDFTRSSNDSKKHRAVNDACRALQVLAGLLTSHPVLRALCSKQNPLCLQPLSKNRKQFLIALCITASKGEVLPHRNPKGLARMYQLFESIAVGIYHYIGENARKKNKQYWWLAFQDEEALTRCKVEVDGSLTDGVVLKAVDEREFERYQSRNHIQLEREKAKSKGIEAFAAADLFEQVC